jgi:hypothetical protein
MTTQITATVVGGMFKPDEGLQLAEQTRVRLTVEPILEAPSRTAAQEAWQSILARLKERPIHGGGMRFTRDELHERR